MTQAPRSPDEVRRDALRLNDEAATLLGRGEAAKAARLLQRAAEELPDQPDILLNLGGAYVLLGRFTEAEAILKRAAELSPNDPMVWSNLGAACLRVPELSDDACQQRAIEAFRKALELDWRARNVAYHLGLVHKLRGEWQEAARCFQIALDADPHDRDAESLLDRMKAKAAGGNGSEGQPAAPPNGSGA